MTTLSANLFSPLNPLALAPRRDLGRQQEVALLQDLLLLAWDAWSICGRLARPALVAHAGGPEVDLEAVVRHGSDHRRTIIALRTRLALLGAQSPSEPAWRERLQLALWAALAHLGWRRGLERAWLEAEAALARYLAAADTRDLSQGSQALVRALRAGQRRPLAPPAGRAVAPPRPFVGRAMAGRHRASATHWAFARL